MIHFHKTVIVKDKSLQKETNLQKFVEEYDIDIGDIVEFKVGKDILCRGVISGVNFFGIIPVSYKFLPFDKKGNVRNKEINIYGENIVKQKR